MTVEPNANPGALRLLPGQLAFPTAPREIFGRPGPLVLEVGFGNAAFLGKLAEQHPDWNLLGVEIAAASVTRGIGLLRRRRFRHARVMCADARFVVRDVLPAGSLHRVYVNFPDPWPKERHQPRRLLQAPFFRLLSTRLTGGGALWFTTDHGEYFEFALDQARQTGLFALEEQDPPADILRTKYAERWQSQRKAIHHVVFAKRDEDPDPHPPRLEVVPMAHARLQGSLDAVDAFEKTVHAITGGHVVLVDLARSFDGRRLLFQVLVEEGDLRQDLLVEARPAPSGVYVEVKHFGAPALTRGVRAAVDRVADWLADQGLQKIEGAGAS